MLLTLHERERLMIYTAAKLALERKGRGLKLNLPESTAVITSFLIEGAPTPAPSRSHLDEGLVRLSRTCRRPAP
jgi:urease subunit gamma